MKKIIENASHVTWMMSYPGAPQIMFAPEKGDGEGAAPTTGEGAETGDSGAGDGDDKSKTAEGAGADAEAEARKQVSEAEAAVNDDDAGKDAEVLLAEKRELLREVMDKKARLKDAQTEAKTAKERLAQFEGVDVEKYRELVQKDQDAEKAAAEAKGDFERVKQMMSEEHERDMQTLKDQLTAAQKEIADRDNLIDGLTVGNDFGSSAFIRDSLTLSPAKARQIYGGHFEVQDGKTVAFDKPSGAKSRTMLVDGRGDPLPFDKAFEKIIAADPDKDTLLKAKTNPGSASATTPGISKTKKPDPNMYGVNRIRASLGGE